MPTDLIEDPHADPALTAATRETALRWYKAQASGDVETLMDCLDPDIEFINYNVVPGGNDAMPWIGHFKGFDETVASFKTFIDTCEPQEEQLLRLVCQGEHAAGAVHEISRVRGHEPAVRDRIRAVDGDPGRQDRAVEILYRSRHDPARHCRRRPGGGGAVMNVMVDLTRQRLEDWLAALGRGDMETAMAGLADDVVFAAPAIYRAGLPMPRPGTVTGKAAIAEMFGARAALVEDVAMTPEGMGGTQGEGWAVATTTERHRATGAEYTLRAVVRFSFDEAGLIRRWESFFDPTPQIAAFQPVLDAALIAALKARDETRVAALLDNGATPTARDEDGLTALMIACGRGLDRATGALLAAGADPFAKDAHAGASALHKACQAGSLACATRLIAAGVPVDEPATTTGHTPLIEAIWFKRPEIAKMLLDHGASLSVRTHYGFSLLDHMAYALKVNQIDQDRLEQAAAFVRAREAADTAQAAALPLVAAAQAGDLAAARAALEAGAAVDSRAPILGGFNDDHTALLIACRDGHDGIVDLLIGAGADVNAVEPTFCAVPLHKATYNGHAAITAKLCAAPAIDIDFQGATNGYTPLHDALWHGFEDCARVLLDAGARLDLQGHDGKTPLDLAVEAFGETAEITARIRADMAR